VIVNKVREDTRWNQAVDEMSGFMTKSVCAAPICSREGLVLGVVEMVNKKEDGGFVEKDVQLLKAFASFAAVALENSRLREVVSGQAELQKYISEDERSRFTIPDRLKLKSDEKNEASALTFFAISWKGIPEIRLFFFLFSKFGLLEMFKITSEMFFGYLMELRNRYNDVPYHNFIHAGDVTQYLAYELSTAKMDRFLTSIEIYGLLVAATAHDANHDGFNNVYNVKSETPLGILFKDQSVMETHHCSQLMEVLGKEEFNLLHTFDPTDYRKVWTLMIQVILSTDMAHHFRLVKTLTEVLDGDMEMVLIWRTQSTGFL
jgi:hypothetical protein